MHYDYQTERPKVFSEDGQVMFLKIRDRVQWLLKESGAFTMAAAMRHVSGDSWTMMACVERLVELGEIEEIPRSGYVWGQDQVYAKPIER